MVFVTTQLVVKKETHTHTHTILSALLNSFPRDGFVAYRIPLMFYCETQRIIKLKKSKLLSGKLIAYPFYTYSQMSPHFRFAL